MEFLKNLTVISILIASFNGYSSEKTQPISQSKLNVIIIKVWYEKTPNSADPQDFQRKTQILCSKSAPISLYEFRKGPVDLNLDDNISCDFGIEGGMATVRISGFIGLMSPNLTPIPTTLTQDFKALSLTIMVKNNLTHDYDIQGTQNICTGTTDLNAQSFLGYISPEERMNCTSDGPAGSPINLGCKFTQPYYIETSYSIQ